MLQGNKLWMKSPPGLVFQILLARDTDRYAQEDCVIELFSSFNCFQLACVSEVDLFRFMGPDCLIYSYICIAEMFSLSVHCGRMFSCELSSRANFLAVLDRSISSSS